MSGIAPPIDFLLMTALPEERDALLARLPRARQQSPLADDTNVYHRTTLDFARDDGTKGHYEVVVTSPSGMSRVPAAVTATTAIRTWRPAYVLLIGIAAGFAKNGAKLGDVLISSQIVDYEQQRLGDETRQPRWQAYPVDTRLLNWAQAFKGNRWQRVATKWRPLDGRPRPIVGPIATGDKVIASEQYVAWLMEHWSKLVGLEMEAGGVIASAHQSALRPGFFMIRGVSDLADADKDKRWRTYACTIAASFAVAFLRSGPVIPLEAPTPAAPEGPPPGGAIPTTAAFGEVAPAGYTMINSALSVMVERQGSVIAVQTDDELARLRQEVREGRRDEARQRLSAIRANLAHWESLGQSHQARVLEFDARLHIDAGGDPGVVRQLTEEVRARDVERAALLDALVTYRNGDPAAALTALGERTDLDGRHLRAALLLARGDVGASTAVLEAIVASGETTAETFRLRALARLANRDLAAAKASADEAAGLASGWTVVRQVVAVLEYWGAVSPLAVPEGLVGWPLPPTWILVKRDDASRARLAAAASTFADLATSAGDAEERRGHRRWQLACLGNDAERQSEAATLCAEILRESPADPCALAWGLARSWPIDTAPGRALLEARVKSGAATPLDIVDLVALELHTGAPERATVLLERTAIRTLFADADARDDWARLRAHAAAAKGDNHRAKVLTSNNFTSPEARQARTVALLATARQRNDERDWVRLGRHLERSADETGDPIFRLTRCEILAERGRWGELAAEADWLVETIGTADALRLAAIAAFNAGQAERCRELLNAHLALFPGSRLPDDLRELLLAALRASGHLLAAIGMAEELACEAETERNLVRLAMLRWEGADRRGVADVARRLAALSGLTGEALRVAEMAAREDRAASIAIWERVTGDALPPEQIPDAVYLGQRLGLREQLDPLLAGIVGSPQGDRGTVRRFSEAEYRDIIEGQHRQLTDLAVRYRRGEIPFHLLPTSPAHHYHPMREEQGDDFAAGHQQPLFIRYGGRAIAAGALRWGEGRLVLDLTALLLAAHLDLLGNVEEAFAPLFLPPALPAAIGDMRSEISRAGPEELASNRAVTRLAAAGGLAAAVMPDGPIAAASEAAGFAITAREDVGDASSIAPAAVIVALRQAGKLTAPETERALKALGGAKATDAMPKLPRATSLYCDGATAVALARAGSLEAASRHYRITLPVADLDALRAADTRDHQAETLDTWLANLQDRINAGLGSAYMLLPYPTEGAAEDEARLLRGNEALPGLGQILRTALGPADLVWVDDRFVSRYERTTTAALVGIIEVLDRLRELGRIDIPRYYATLDQLRADNARFVALTADDIDYHLDTADLDDGTQVETRELAVLRRYTASCLLAGSDLQPPRRQDPTALSFGEAEIVVAVRRAVTDRLAAAWDDEDEQRVETRAGWLFGALYVDALAALDIAGMTRQDHDRRALRALGFADLVSQAISFRDATTDAGRERRRRYLTWLHEHILAPQFAADPALRASVAALLGQLIGGLLDDARDLPRGGPLVAMLWANFFTDLPDDLQDALAVNATLLGRLGLERRTAVVIGALTFDAPDIEAALVAALAGKSSTLEAREPKVTVDCEPLPAQEGLPRCRLVRRDTGAIEFPETGQLVLMLDTTEARAAGLRRFPSWFDCDADRRERAIEAIAALPTVEERHVAVRGWRARSGAEHFDALARRIVQERAFDLTDLLPVSVEGLPDHLRLAFQPAPNVHFADEIEQGASALVAEFGPVEAFARLGALPVELPAPIIGALAAQGEAERAASLRRILRLAATPALLTQAIRILRHFGEGEAATNARVRGLARRAVGTRGEAACAAFVAILTWVASELIARPEAQDWPTATRLAVAWSCADRLYRIFHAAGAPDDFLQRSFRGQGGRPIARLAWDGDYELDVAHPQQSRTLPLIAAASAYALDGADEPSLPRDWRERWAALALTDVGGRNFPVFPLLRDLTGAGDNLASWLAAPWQAWLAALLSPGGKLLGREAARERIDRVIAHVSGPGDDVEAWAELHFTLGSLPAPADLAGPLAERLGAVDLVTVMRRDETLGRIALEATAVQLRAKSDAASLEHVRGQVLALAEYSASREAKSPGEETEGREEQLAQTFVATAIWLAQARGGGQQEVANHAAGVLEEIIARSPATASLVRYGLLSWCLALPPDLGAPFWRVLSLARAS